MATQLLDGWQQGSRSNKSVINYPAHADLLLAKGRRLQDAAQDVRHATTMRRVVLASCGVDLIGGWIPTRNYLFGGNLNIHAPARCSFCIRDQGKYALIGREIAIVRHGITVRRAIGVVGGFVESCH